MFDQQQPVGEEVELVIFRRLKDRQKLNVTMDGWRAEERRLQGLNVKHQMASSLYCAFKEEKERLREANLV